MGRQPRITAVVVVSLSTALLAFAFANASEKSKRSARTNYVLHCSGCHGLDGAGSLKGGIPDFRNFVGGFAGDEDGRTYVVSVPGVRNAALPPDATAAVLNYVVASFAGSSPAGTHGAFTSDEVARRQALAVTDVVALRRTVAARLKAKGMPVADYPWP